MADATPHLAFPLRLRAGRFLAVDQGSRRHLEDQAEVLLRTRPNTLDADPTFGVRDLVASTGLVGPEVHAALERDVGAFDVAEGLPERVRNVAVAISQDDRED